MNRFLKLTRRLNGLVAVGITGAFIYVKINNHEKCKQMLETRKNDPSLVLPPSVKNLVNEVMNDMKLKEEVKSRIRLFMSETAEFQRHGTIKQKQGALLGIPQYFSIDEETDIKVSTLDKNKLTDVRDSKLGDSLQLDIKAKKFAIAHELYELLNSYTYMLHSVPLMLSLWCIFVSYSYERLALRKPVRISPYLVHGLLMMLAALCYILSFDLIILYSETNADFLACDLGKSYITGGLEYYRKMLRKNIALKKLDKNAPYSDDGDVNYSVFGKHHMPLQKRLIYIKDISTKKQKPSVWDYIFNAH